MDEVSKVTLVEAYERGFQDGKRQALAEIELAAAADKKRIEDLEWQLEIQERSGGFGV